MKEEEYPSLYRVANRVSSDAQRNFFLALAGHLIALIVAAALSVAAFPHWIVAACQVFALLIALSCSVYLFSVRPDKSWYLGRAVAESIKTIAWRYACRAEPFESADASAKAAFRGRIRVIGEQNRSIFHSPVECLGGPQITAAMDAIRALSLEGRVASYLKLRIDDQLRWYSDKAQFNRNVGRTFFWALIVANAVALTFAVIRVAFPERPFWPTDIFVAVAASLLAWIQAKRFSELSGAYSLAAYEIGLIKEQVGGQDSEDKFSAFVGDAENAFSREHTLWVARRDM